MDTRLDMWQRELAFKTLVCRVISLTRIKVQGKTMDSKSFWYKAAGINSCKYILGHARPGICRRPLAPDADWALVVKHIHKAFILNEEKTTMGVGYHPILTKSSSVKWTPSAIHTLTL